jgi:hypothetical protein
LQNELISAVVAQTFSVVAVVLLSLQDMFVIVVCRPVRYSCCGRTFLLLLLLQNMFLALTLNNISWLLWYHLVLFQEGTQVPLVFFFPC